MIQAQEIKLELLHPNRGQIEGVPANPRKVTKKQVDKLIRSIKETPAILELREIIAYDNNGELVIIGGERRFEAQKKMKKESAIVKILPQNTPKEELKAILIKDNTHTGDWDNDLLSMEWDKTQISEWGVDTKGWDKEVQTEDKEQNEKVDEDLQEKIDFFELMLGDRLYNSDNEFDIPILLLDKQPKNGVLLPFAAWGADSRLRKDIQTYCFYVEDYRFEAIWKDPVKVLESGCVAVVEPNLSLFDTTPIAYGLQQIYKKRWIARYFQECGIDVYADLNVARKFYKYNQLGIPKGYNAFATRGYTDREEYLKEEIQIAREISGLQTPNMIVYGGGAKIEKIAKENGLIYIEQFMQNKGR